MNIGIACRYDKGRYYLNDSYLSYFKKFSNTIEILNRKSKIDNIDVVIIPGGFDIDPKYYNQTNSTSFNINSYNDRLDFKLIALSIILNKKIIGICRGIQSLNVFFNGSLKQDIYFHNKNNHFVNFNNKYQLLNSFHHQSINNLGYNLKIIGLSVDGEIEAILYKKILGVQFHPELCHTPNIDKFLFDFINEA